jgi:BTB/POZ domain
MGSSLQGGERGIGGRAPGRSGPAPANRDGDVNAGGEIVDVNVGGVHFATTRHTLCSALEPRSMLAAMFGGGGGGIPSRTDRHGCVFIDRDGGRFRQVLNYLRSGTVHCDADCAALSELLEEAEYFGMSLAAGYCSVTHLPRTCRAIRYVARALRSIHPHAPRFVVSFFIWQSN